LGDIKNKEELDKFRKSVRKESIRNGIAKLDKKYSPFDLLFSDFSPYVEK